MEKSSDTSANFRTYGLSQSAPASFENWSDRGYSIPCSIDIPVSRRHEEYDADWHNDAARIKYNSARERYDYNSSDHQDNPELYHDNQYQTYTPRRDYELNQKSSETMHKQLPPYVNIVSLLQDSQVEIVLKFHGTSTAQTEKPSLHQDSDVSSSMDDNTG